MTSKRIYSSLGQWGAGSIPLFSRKSFIHIFFWLIRSLVNPTQRLLYAVPCSLVTRPWWALYLSPRYNYVKWSANTSFWQLSISHNMDLQYPRCTYGSGAALLHFKVLGLAYGRASYDRTYATTIGVDANKNLALSLATHRSFSL